MSDLQGKRALVTGGASGIGAAAARALTAAGASVTVADLDGEGAARVAAEIHGTPWQVDLSKPEALDGLSLDVDVLVNNAGVQTVSPIEEFDPARWRFIVDLMLVAPFQLVRAALPGMYDRGWGRMINISSVHGLRASAYKSAYVSAKHGLEGLSKTIALEGGAKGVTSNCIEPSYVRTPLVEQQIADQARSRLPDLGLPAAPPRPTPTRQGHQAAQPATPQLRSEPNLVPTRRTRISSSRPTNSSAGPYKLRVVIPSTRPPVQLYHPVMVSACSDS